MIRGNHVSYDYGPITLQRRGPPKYPRHEMTGGLCGFDCGMLKARISQPSISSITLKKGSAINGLRMVSLDQSKAPPPEQH